MENSKKSERDSTEHSDRKRHIHIKIEDRVKAEVPIMCEMLYCSERGEYPRCYLDIYRGCPFYKVMTRERNI